MYKYTLNFLNYWKVTEEENLEFKNKITILKNTTANFKRNFTTSCKDSSEELN